MWKWLSGTLLLLSSEHPMPQPFLLNAFLPITERRWGCLRHGPERRFDVLTTKNLFHPFGQKRFSSQFLAHTPLAEDVHHAHKLGKRNAIVKTAIPALPIRRMFHTRGIHLTVYRVLKVNEISEICDCPQRFNLAAH